MVDLPRQSALRAESRRRHHGHQLHLRHGLLQRHHQRLPLDGEGGGYCYVSVGHVSVHADRLQCAGADSQPQSTALGHRQPSLPWSDNRRLGRQRQRPLPVDNLRHGALQRFIRQQQRQQPEHQRHTHHNRHVRPLRHADRHHHERQHRPDPLHHHRQSGRTAGADPQSQPAAERHCGGRLQRGRDDHRLGRQRHIHLLPGDGGRRSHHRPLRGERTAHRGQWHYGLDEWHQYAGDQGSAHHGNQCHARRHGDRQLIPAVGTELHPQCQPRRVGLCRLRHRHLHRYGYRLGLPGAGSQQLRRLLRPRHRHRRPYRRIPRQRQGLYHQRRADRHLYAASVHGQHRHQFLGCRRASRQLWRRERLRSHRHHLDRERRRHHG